MNIFNKNEIVFEKQLPKINLMPKIDINYIDYGTNVRFNFYSTLAVLQSILKIINDIKIKNLYKDILSNILEYSGNENKLKKNTSFTYINYCFSEFDIDKRGGLGTGSDIYNYSSIYMNYISVKYIKCFIKNKLTDKTIIKFPTCNSIVSYQYLYLLCYIYDNVKIIKTINDTPFRDSYYIICEGIINKNYENIKNKLNKYNFIENNNINIIYEENDLHKVFNNLIDEFYNDLIILVSSYLFSLKEIIELSLKNNDRYVENTKHIYQYFDLIANGNDFINNNKFEEHLLL